MGLKSFSRSIAYRHRGGLLMRMRVSWGRLGPGWRGALVVICWRLDPLFIRATSMKGKSRAHNDNLLFSRKAQ